MASGTKRRSLASAQRPINFEKFNSFFASPSNAEWVIRWKCLRSTCSTIRFLILSSDKLFAYISRSIRSN